MNGAPAARLVGARYQIINEIARGGMGAVHRALDRLTGRVVTVKRLGEVTTPGSAGSVGLRLTLAREFRLLASLRHPNVISVLDYGFDDDGSPFLVMDLEENARTIVEAGQSTPFAMQVDLLVQTLRAVAYLHRLGIIHRDLKPENILVVHEQVKVLDFGLSVSRSAPTPSDAAFAGTPAYMAPEVLAGQGPSEQSDLYAFGMVAHEVLTGVHPMRRHDGSGGTVEALTLAGVPLAREAIDPRLRPVIERLLAVDLPTRYGSVAEVMSALEGALGRPLGLETVATRESVLQTAPLTGRDEELTMLHGALREALAGRGSTWLVGGESGVGKSRVLDELRTRALIEGAVVVAGQVVSEGGTPYHAWRDVVSALALRVELNDADAATLTAINRDMGGLLGRAIAPPDTTNSEAAQTRLLFAVEDVFRLQLRPVVVILDDLHWAGSESLRLLAWLTQAAAQLQVLLVGSYRNDERPQLPESVEGARTLPLRRLTRREIGAVGEAMIGPIAQRTDVLDVLERETEGIPFFVVEVVRALAEHAGTLDRVGTTGMPSRIVSGGMQKVVRRRLARVPAEALPALRTAAVVGRGVDGDTLAAVHPDLDVAAWTSECARSAVLEVRDQRWVFAHDKLREQLIEDMSAAARRDVHRRVGEALERLHSERPDRLAALAHHWAEAGDVEREARYARGAGFVALRTSACREAVSYLLRARELLLGSGGPTRVRGGGYGAFLNPNRAVSMETPSFVLGLIEGGLSEAFYRLGDLKACREHSERALRHYGQPVPRGPVGWVRGFLEQGLVRTAQLVLRTRTRDPERDRQVAGEVARVQLRLTDVYFYSLRLGPILWSSLRVVNQCEPAGPLPELAQGYVVLALLAGAARSNRLADRWGKRALEIAKGTGVERNVAWIRSRLAVHQVAQCRWDDAEAGLAQASAVAERAGDLRLREETRIQHALVLLYTGRFEPACAMFDEAYALSRRSGNRQIESWAVMGKAAAQSRLGHDGDAVRLLGSAVEVIDEEIMKAEAICAFGLLGLAQLRSGDEQRAYDAADRTMWHTRSMRPVAYWLQPSLAGAAETLLTLLERGWRPTPQLAVNLRHRTREAVAAMTQFGRHFPLGRPHALVWAGLDAWTKGRPRAAMRAWTRAIVVAERLGTPYELARAHLEIARHASPDDRDRTEHLHVAAGVFDRLGCTADFARAREEMRSRPAGGPP